MTLPKAASGAVVEKRSARCRGWVARARSRQTPLKRPDHPRVRMPRRWPTAPSGVSDAVDQPGIDEFVRYRFRARERAHHEWEHLGVHRGQQPSHQFPASGTVVASSGAPHSRVPERGGQGHMPHTTEYQVDVVRVRRGSWSPQEQLAKPRGGDPVPGRGGGANCKIEGSKPVCGATRAATPPWAAAPAH
jgi:hypothetical protein